MRAATLLAAISLIVSGSAHAFDPAKLETIPLGTSQDEIRKTLGEPDKDLTHIFPFVTYEFDYAQGQAKLTFDYDKKLAAITFTPAHPDGARAFDPAKLDAVKLGDSMARIRRTLGEPSEITRDKASEEMVYDYSQGPEKRQAHLFFYAEKRFEQIMYSPVWRSDAPAFDPANLAGIHLGDPERTVEKVLGVPGSVEYSSTFDTKDYFYPVHAASGDEWHSVTFSFWPPGKITNIDRRGPSHFGRSFEAATLARLTNGMTKDEVRSLLGEADLDIDSIYEGDLYYGHCVSSPETRSIEIRFTADGRLAGYSISKGGSAKPIALAATKLDALKPGLSRAGVAALLGNADPSFAYLLPRCEPHMEYLHFSKEGQLTSFADQPEAESTPMRGADKRGLPGPETTASDVRKSLGDPDVEKHGADGAVEFDYALQVPRGPDGGGGDDYTTSYYFAPDGRFHKLVNSGDGARMLELPAEWP
jgi:outer membrane protein assembly factor BamE (lipoprotein component of BamABCDE complex)